MYALIGDEAEKSKFGWLEIECNMVKVKKANKSKLIVTADIRDFAQW